ncbi:MAG: hypothetical protein QM692_13000 [Thermomicrobiales bacterium]
MALFGSLRHRLWRASGIHRLWREQDLDVLFAQEQLPLVTGVTIKLDTVLLQASTPPVAL